MRPAPDGYRVTDLDAWAASSTVISDDEVRELAEGGLDRCGLARGSDTETEDDGWGGL